jgi:hypothetical protein
MSAVIVATSSRGLVRRAADWLLSLYVEYRLHAAESDLASLEREIVNRARQTQAHRHYCQALRVRLTTLRN